MPSFMEVLPSVYRISTPIILILLSMVPSALLASAILPGHSLYFTEDCGPFQLTDFLTTPSCLHSW